MKKRLIITLGVFLLCFVCLVGACPEGQMTNFDGSCIPDPNYNAGPVKAPSTSTPTSTPTTTTTTTTSTSGTYEELRKQWDDNQCRWGGTSKFSEAQCDQLQKAMDEAEPLSTSDVEGYDEYGVHKPNIQDCSYEATDQYTTKGACALLNQGNQLDYQITREVQQTRKNYDNLYFQVLKLQEDYNTDKSTRWVGYEPYQQQIQTEFNNCLDGTSHNDVCYNTWKSKSDKEKLDYYTADIKAAQETLQKIKDFKKQESQKESETAPKSGTGSTPLEKQLDQQLTPDADDSAQLMESVVQASHRQHDEEVAAIKKHYEVDFPARYFIDPMETDAQNKFEETRPLGLDVVNAKNDYQEALKKGASSEDVAKLKSDYDQKIQKLQGKLDDVLDADSSNPDALWQLGTLSKWQGDNKKAYESYRESLSAERNRNVFAYQKRLDSITCLEVRMQLLQEMNPQEKVINIPTFETSPILKGLKDNLKTLVQPVTEKMRGAAEEIEKISRAFSYFDRLATVKKDLSFSPLGGEENE
ncbi:MAG: hypothetical protein V2A62_02020 [Candidatus Woesearchaeota archaeon]